MSLSTPVERRSDGEHPSRKGSMHALLAQPKFPSPPQEVVFSPNPGRGGHLESGRGGLGLNLIHGGPAY
jgi:hypothetical protein